MVSVSDEFGDENKQSARVATPSTKSINLKTLRTTTFVSDQGSVLGTGDDEDGNGCCDGGDVMVGCMDNSVDDGLL